MFSKQLYFVAKICRMYSLYKAARDRIVKVNKEEEGNRVYFTAYCFCVSSSFLKISETSERQSIHTDA
jgi:hypothetical protein